MAKITPKTNRAIDPAIFQSMKLIAKKDLRVGQMFDNVFAQIREDGRDPFYIENDIMLIYLLDYLYGTKVVVKKKKST